MMGNQNPVGVFDSGVGGIGTLSALRRELPQEDFLYFGDTLPRPLWHEAARRGDGVCHARDGASALESRQGGGDCLQHRDRCRREGTAGDV